MKGLELAIALILGAVLGSFLNVCIYRLPREESIIWPGSHCPHCRKPLAWYDNIPLLSYLILRGRCRYCKAPISWRYPVVELATVFLAGALYMHFGLKPVYFIFLAFACALLVASFIDLEFQIIPDEISLPGILVGLASSPFNPLTTPLEALLGALCGAGGLYLVAEFYYFLTKREGLGGGDLKLLAMIGAFLGVKSLLPVLLLASFTGATAGIILTFIRKVKEVRTYALPFGPFLALGALIYLFYPRFLAFWLPF